MATSYTSLLGLALPVQGELSGTWGDTVNNFITTYIDSAVAGTIATITTDATLTKTTNASLGTASSQYAILLCNPASVNITVTVPAASKIYTVVNLSTTYSVTVKATGQTGTVVAPSSNITLVYNGTDFFPAGGYLNIPQNAQTGNYTTVLGDSGRHIYHAVGAGAATYTIAANASVAYPIGTVIAFVNLSATSISIAITTDTMYLGGTGTTGTRTLAQYGVANALKITSTAWVITGTALT